MGQAVPGVAALRPTQARWGDMPTHAVGICPRMGMCPPPPSMGWDASAVPEGVI